MTMTARALKSSKYMTLKLAFQDVAIADHSARQTMAMMQETCRLVEVVRKNAADRLAVLLTAHRMKPGQYTFDDAHCTITRVGDLPTPKGGQ